MSGVDNDREAGARERAERARRLAGEGDVEQQSTPSAQKSRKENTWEVADAALRRAMYAMNAPLPIQAWRAGESVVHATKELATGTRQNDAMANEVKGVRLLALVEKELPKTTGADVEAIVAGEFRLHAQYVARGKDEKDVLFYIASRHGRAEFAVGKDSLDTFKKHPDMYARQAEYGLGLGASDARPYERSSYEVVEDIRNGDLTGAAVENLHAWEQAWSDPVWTAQQAMNIGAAMAPETRAVRQLRVARAAAADVRAGAPNAAPILAPDVAVESINVPRGTLNCANCAVATDATLAGHPTTALPGKLTNATDVADFYGRSWSDASPLSSVEAAMKQAGPGARGIVLGARPGGPNVPGHFFNVVNEGGAIHFVDGQVGGTADLSPRQGYDRFYLLPTN
jgi:hypothetical protein